MPASLVAFLAEDFDRLGPALLERAAAIEGRRLMLSGATGFFGTNLLALLAFLHGRGIRFQVSALSRDPAGFVERQPWAARLPWLALHQGDAREPWPITSPHDLLMHAATDTHAGAHQDLQAVFDHMLAATRQALAAGTRCGVRRLLLTGSGAQYAVPHDDVKMAETTPACDPMLPGSAYGEAKRVSELLAAMHAQALGTSVVATRCFAFVGPGLPLDGHFAIGNFIADALAGRDIEIKSAGLAERSYLYSADLALWLLLLLLEAPAGTAVNVGSDEALSIRELAHRVRDQLAPHAAVTVGMEGSSHPRPRYVPAIDTARQLGLAVWTPLPLAIERTAAWFRLARA